MISHRDNWFSFWIRYAHIVHKRSDTKDHAEKSYIKVRGKNIIHKTVHTQKINVNAKIVCSQKVQTQKKKQCTKDMYANKSINKLNVHLHKCIHKKCAQKGTKKLE